MLVEANVPLSFKPQVEIERDTFSQFIPSEVKHFERHCTSSVYLKTNFKVTGDPFKMHDPGKVYKKPLTP